MFLITKYFLDQAALSTCVLVASHSDSRRSINSSKSLESVWLRLLRYPPNVAHSSLTWRPRHELT